MCYLLHPGNNIGVILTHQALHARPTSNNTMYIGMDCYISWPDNVTNHFTKKHSITTYIALIVTTAIIYYYVLYTKLSQKRVKYSAQEREKSNLRDNETHNKNGTRISSLPQNLMYKTMVACQLCYLTRQ
jgi:preprotein translocase subunit SecY